MRTSRKRRSEFSKAFPFDMCSVEHRCRRQQDTLQKVHSPYLAVQQQNCLTSHLYCWRRVETATKTPLQLSPTNFCQVRLPLRRLMQQQQDSAIQGALLAPRGAAPKVNSPPCAAPSRASPALEIPRHSRACSRQREPVQCAPAVKVRGSSTL